MCRFRLHFAVKNTRMIRLFRHYVPNAVLLLGVLDLILLLVSGLRASA